MRVANTKPGNFSKLTQLFSVGNFWDSLYLNKILPHSNCKLTRNYWVPQFHFLKYLDG